MTKLTKEQIEQERVKFEGWYKGKFGCLCKLVFLDNHQFANDSIFYRDMRTDSDFKTWLARAELDKGE